MLKSVRKSLFTSSQNVEYLKTVQRIRPEGHLINNNNTIMILAYWQLMTKTVSDEMKMVYKTM